MKIFIKPDNHRLSFTHKKLIGAVFLSLATITLFACSEPDAEVSNVAQAEPAVTTQTAQAAEPQAELTAATPPLSNQSDLLKNVSATVYKDANCGCCKDWISHAEDYGMTAEGQDVADLAVFKQRYGVPDNMRSCHTTVTSDGYVFEGHIPAKHVAQFLKNPPSEAIGLAVPGMPMGSPGMEYQNRFDPYQVMQINKDGSSTVYAQIESPQQQL